MNSSWFNGTDDTDGVFVPTSCCVPVSLQSRDIVARENSEQRDNYCQLHAILYPNSLNKSHYLNIKVLVHIRLLLLLLLLGVLVCHSLAQLSWPNNVSP